MTTKKPETADKNMLERNFAPIITSLILVGITTAISLFFSFNAKFTDLSVRVEFATKQIGEMKTQIDMLVKGYATKEDMQRLEDRVQRVEQRGR